MSSRRNSFLVGAVIGAVVALGALALSVGRMALQAVTLEDGTAVVSVRSGSAYLLVLIAAALGGLFIGAVGYATGTPADPETPRFPLRFLLPISAVTAAILAYATLRVGVGGFGDIGGGVIEIGALRLTITAVAMGVVGGGVTAALVDSLARPEMFEFEGEAWPSSGRAVMAAMMSAVSAPIIAAVLAASFAIPLSIILIELEGNAAVVMFSVVGAIILGAAALIAARPWDPPAER